MGDVSTKELFLAIIHHPPFGTAFRRGCSYYYYCAARQQPLRGYGHVEEMMVVKPTKPLTIDMTMMQFLPL